MAAENKKHGLGRGLESLLGDDLNFLNFNSESAQSVSEGLKDGRLHEIDINSIIPCNFQPRTKFDEEALQTLCDSIKEKGILQPLLVRPKDKKYEIIAGERRWRAAKMAELEKVPVIIKKLSNRETLEIALIENIQRENLSAIEEAMGLNRLIQEYNYTQNSVAKILGKSRSYVTNTLRLLTLPQDVQEAVRENKLSAGHARALIGFEKASDLAQNIIEKGLSVRAAEYIVNQFKKSIGKNKGTPKIKNVNLDVENLVKDLEKKLKLKVKINAGKSGKGSVTLYYDTPARLCAILDLLEQR